MQTDSCRDLLHLYHNFGPNRRSLTDLLELFDGDASRIRATSRSELQQLGFSGVLFKKIHQPEKSGVSRDLAWARLEGNQIIPFSDAAYPALLREISDPPVLLFTSGEIELLKYPQIAIVGSRLCTPGGAQNAIEFARQLAQAGFAITSGLAQGIDSHAHQGALLTGTKTIAVCGTGLDRVYPASNRELASRIRDGGLLVTEFSPGTAPRAANFPQRNRIISGLSLATLVVEATQRSGSLITARLAAEQGREVFAIPGSIHNPQSRGCHQLIRDGARLAESAADIIAEISSLLDFAIDQHKPETGCNISLETGQRRLLELIGYDPVDIDCLMERSGLTIDKLSSMLLILEINELIQSAPGGCYVRNQTRYT